MREEFGCQQHHRNRLAPHAGKHLLEYRQHEASHDDEERYLVAIPQRLVGRSHERTQRECGQQHAREARPHTGNQRIIGNVFGSRASPYAYVAHCAKRDDGNPRGDEQQVQMRARPVGHDARPIGITLPPCARQSDQRDERAYAAHDDLRSRAQRRACRNTQHLFDHLARKCHDDGWTQRNSPSQRDIERRHDPQVPHTEHERYAHAEHCRSHKRLVKRNSETCGAEAHDQRQVRPHAASEAFERPRNDENQQRNRHASRMIRVPRRLERGIG